MVEINSKANQIKDLFSQGDGKSAWDVVNEINVPKDRLLVILEILNTHNNVDNNIDMIKLCDMGTSMIKIGRLLGIKAYLLAKKANLLSLEVSFKLHSKTNLNLSPGWNNFSLEAEKEHYYYLNEKIEQNLKTIKYLFSEALKIVDDNNLKKDKARILIFIGEFHGSRYLYLKIENIKKVKFTPLLNIFPYNNFIHSLLVDNNTKRQLKECIRRTKIAFLESIKIYDSSEEKLLKAYALYNFTNQLKTFCQFREAKKYLIESEKIALNFQENNLLALINVMKISIKSRNRDIPDYINGEIR